MKLLVNITFQCKMSNKILFSKIDFKPKPKKKIFCHKIKKPTVQQFYLSGLTKLDLNEIKISINDIENVKNEVFDEVQCETVTKAADMTVEPYTANDEVKNMLKRRYLKSKIVNEIDFPLLFGARKVLEYMYSAWTHQCLCDLILKTRRGEILTHQVLFSAYSLPFKQYFFENKHKVFAFDLSEFSRESILCIVRYLYTREIKINCLNLVEIVKFAKRTQIDLLQKISEEYLVANLNWQSSLLHYCIAVNNNLVRSRDTCLEFIGRMEPPVTSHPHLLQILLNHLTVLLNFLKPKIPTKELLKIVLEWMSYDVKERICHAENLFAYFDFTKISEKKIEIFEKYKNVIDNDDVKKILSKYQ